MRLAVVLFLLLALALFLVFVQAEEASSTETESANEYLEVNEDLEAEELEEDLAKQMTNKKTAKKSKACKGKTKAEKRKCAAKKKKALDKKCATLKKQKKKLPKSCKKKSAKKTSCKGKTKAAKAKCAKKALTKKCAKLKKQKKKLPKECKTKPKKSGKQNPKKAKSSGKTSRKMEIAVQDEFAFTYDDANVRNIAWGQAKAIGATVLRKMLSLHLLHSCRGQEAKNELGRLDRMVTEARSHGMTVQLTICGVAAEWGLPRGCAAKFKPTGEKPSIANYKKTVRSLVTHFAQRGVIRFSSWNEPNHPTFLCNGKSVSKGGVDETVCKDDRNKRFLLYGNLHRAAWSVVKKLKKAKKISKNVQLWYGEWSGNGMIASEVIFKSGKIYADAYAFHPYQYCNPPNGFKKSFAPGSTCRKTTTGGIASTKKTQAFIAHWAKKGRFVTAKGKRPPLFLTEFGYHRNGEHSIPENYRAKWYPMAMTVAKKAGARGMNVYQMFHNTGPGSDPKVWDTGIIPTNGAATPVSNALRNWAIKNKYKVS
jgi:colicin import membrane protein